MIESQAFNNARQHAADGHAILDGLIQVLDEMEGELAGDSRYYALMACLDKAVHHIDEACEGFDMYAMEDEKLGD
jgi:hypothetical protein